MILSTAGSRTAEFDESETRRFVDSVLDALRARGPLRRVLLIPPDYTRAHSAAGPITCFCMRRSETRPRSPSCRRRGRISRSRRGRASRRCSREFPPIGSGTTTGVIGVATARRDLGRRVMSKSSEGTLGLPAPVQVDRLLLDESWDAILSIGQLVPHEVIGIANHVKNILVGAGGPDLIHKSHWLGAVYGMERIMGRAKTPGPRLAPVGRRSIPGASADHIPLDRPRRLRRRPARHPRALRRGRRRMLRRRAPSSAGL